MITTAGYELLADIFTEESADTITKLSIGYGTAPETLTDSALDDAYTNYGFEQVTVTGSYADGIQTFTNVFTNNHTASRTITEVGLFSTAGVLIYRRLFSVSELANFGIIPAGKAITISVKLTYSDSVVVAVAAETSISPLNYNIYVSGSTANSIDLTTFETVGDVCFNGILLPYAGIPKFTEALGAKSWDFTCYTETYSEVTNILPYAGPVTTGNSITGKQYVISAYRSGCLAIRNMTTRLFSRML